MPLKMAQRAYSIKTRIKTIQNKKRKVEITLSQRAYSIKTRIKTHIYPIHGYSKYILREHIPLKQGLRLR